MHMKKIQAGNQENIDILKIVIVTVAVVRLVKVCSQHTN